MTYECVICHGINSAARLHCQFCDTIPAEYSIIRKPAHERLSEYTETSYINVLVAWGAERQVSRRSIKRTARTVPLDYYAEV
jgi:hypothetical protein